MMKKDPILEELRREMVTAFHMYNKMYDNHREGFWLAYIQARERFLILDCKRKDIKYDRLQFVEMDREGIN
jgi:hypothetical protein